MVRLNRFGVPWIAAIVSASVPILVLLIMHDLDSLAALYAIGVIGAVAINVSLCSIHPRLRRPWRKICMMVLGIVLLIIWVTLAFVKHEALIFVCIVMVVGLVARQLSRWLGKRKGPSRACFARRSWSSYRQRRCSSRRFCSARTARTRWRGRRCAVAKESDATLVVCFIRQVNLSYKYESDQKLTIETDLAALKAFAVSWTSVTAWVSRCCPSTTPAPTRPS